MKFQLLTAEEAAMSGYTHKWEITYADCTDADTSMTITLFTATAGTEIKRAAYRLVTEFDDTATGAGNGSLTDCNLSVGDANSATRWVSTAETSVQGTAVAYGASATTVMQTASTAVTATIATTGVNTNALLSGKVWIWMHVWNAAGMS